MANLGTGLTPVLGRIDQDFDASVERLKTLLRFPSIGVDPAYEAETKACAAWLAETLQVIGLEAAVRPTAGRPMVVAHDRSAPAGAPHLLYYGHYDVQPADPLELWESPPFEPVVKEGPHGPRIVARGAVDDKGQVMTFIEAIRAWKAVHGSLPVRVSILLEGEEEGDGASMAPFLRANRDEFAADVCVVSDTDMLGPDKPAITYMLRGTIYAEVTLHGPSHDLHSGGYGGAVVNPINALCRILADLHDDQGRVRIQGFYDDVREPDAAELAAWKELDFDEAAFVDSAGLKASTGEAGRSVLERIWSRPTCDVNGIWGGYTGEGAKTVIAAKASAKLSCRLVADQDPVAMMAALRRFFDERTPTGCHIEFSELGVAGAMRVPTRSPYLDAATKAVIDVFGRPPALVGSGGSIPVVAEIKEILGLDTILLGFGLDDDRVHSPNEKFELVCFRRGIETHAALLQRMGELRTAQSA
ncbi:MAG: dipeptidase [Geminicoccaceae bacterium]